MTHKLGCPPHAEKWAGRAMNHSGHHCLSQGLSNGPEAEGANLSRRPHRGICCWLGVATTLVTHQKGTDTAAGSTFLQRSWWQLSQCRGQLWCPIPSLQMAPSHVLHKHHLREAVLLKEASHFLPVNSGRYFSQSWQIHYELKLFF